MQAEFWEESRKSYGAPATTIPADFRTRYQKSHVATLMDGPIRALHDKIGNVVHANKTLVYGMGGTQILNLLVRSLQSLRGVQTVFQSAPYYAGYATRMALPFNSSLDQPDPTSLMEILTLPNNPDGRSDTAPFYPTATLVYDLVYYWPGLCASACPEGQLPRLNASIMLFSATKFMGLAGSRFGWALVDDSLLAVAMRDNVDREIFSMAAEPVYRTYEALQYLLSNNGVHLDRMINNMATKLSSRWSAMNAVFEKYPNSSITMSGNRNSSYGWFYCDPVVFLNSSSCPALFLQHGVLVNSGALYGDPNNVRVSLLSYSADFAIFIERLDTILATASNTTLLRQYHGPMHFTSVQTQCLLQEAERGDSADIQNCL